uniref:Proline-rich nuclear receptor coactivator 2 n=1 Tax=Strigamia maritima TaxID=126957 RepID=T1JJN9_STRMM
MVGKGDSISLPFTTYDVQKQLSNPSASCHIESNILSPKKMLILGRKMESGPSKYVKSPLRRRSESNGSPPSTSTNSSPNTIAYAGAKFSDPPAPNSLPRPPSHWMNGENRPCAPSKTGGIEICNEISNQLKVMLNVQE